MCFKVLGINKYYDYIYGFIRYWRRFFGFVIGRILNVGLGNRYKFS